MGLMNAIGQGLSAASYGMGEQLGKLSLMERQSALEEQRATRLAEFKALLEAKNANTAREEQVARIDAKENELIEERVAPVRGLMDAETTDAVARRPDNREAHQASLDKGVEDARKGLKGKLRTEAAVSTGDISPKDAAQIESKGEIAQLRHEGLMANVQAKLDMARDRLEMAQTVATIRAASRGEADNKTPADQKMIEYLKSQGYKAEDAIAMVMKTDPRQSDPARMAASLATTILNQDSSINRRAKEAGKTPAELAMEQAMGMITQAEQKFAPNRRPVGEAPAPAAKPAASAPTLKTLPPGSRQVGTSGGKPVYETPDGKRFIAQ